MMRLGTWCTCALPRLVKDSVRVVARALKLWRCRGFCCWSCCCTAAVSSAGSSQPLLLRSHRYLLFVNGYSRLEQTLRGALPSEIRQNTSFKLYFSGTLVVYSSQFCLGQLFVCLFLMFFWCFP